MPCWAPESHDLSKMAVVVWSTKDKTILLPWKDKWNWCCHHRKTDKIFPLWGFRASGLLLQYTVLWILLGSCDNSDMYRRVKLQKALVFIIPTIMHTDVKGVWECESCLPGRDGESKPPLQVEADDAARPVVLLPCGHNAIILHSTLRHFRFEITSQSVRVWNSLYARGDQRKNAFKYRLWNEWL